MVSSLKLSIVLGLFLLATSALLSTVSAGGEVAEIGWMLTSAGSGDLIGDAEEEFEMDSESNRRILATRRYISYGALQRNSVPCSRRGASYYNCRPGAQANPYNRGCSAITRCRS